MMGIIAKAIDELDRPPRPPVEHVRHFVDAASIVELRRDLPRVIPLPLAPFGEAGIRPGDTIRLVHGPEKGPQQWMVIPVESVVPFGDSMVLVGLGKPHAWHDLGGPDRC
jgi:hypothetical protein